MKKISLDAVVFRYILLTSVIVTLIAIGVIGYFSQSLLADKAQSVDRKKIESDYALEEIQVLQNLRRELKENKATIEKADQIVATAQSYRYQNQIINDINAYANRTEVGIEGFDFSNDKTDPSTQKSSLSTAKKLIVGIKIQNDTPYTNFLRFLRSIEENNTKLQLTGVNLVPSSQDPAALSQTSLEVEVFVQ